ncbi:MAG: hypothetical protein QOE68_427 [Thermoanaerobaculia bacterium]|jgi:hypothetical protein|nr:hypothetical protein [Thermoanaerobaculia bacterium]
MSSPFVLSVKDPPFNATGDGHSNDTDAIQRAINAAQQHSVLAGANVGPTVYFPPGEYVVSDTLLLDTALCMNIEGSGAASSIVGQIPYVPGARKPLFRFASTAGCALRRLGLTVVEPRYRCDGIHIETKLDYHLISTRLAIESVWMSGSGNIDDCVFIGGGLNANNDFHTVDNCTFQGYRRNAVHLDNSQVYGIAISRTWAAGERMSVMADFIKDSPVVKVPRDKFTADDVGMYVWPMSTPIIPRLRRKIVAVTDATHVTLDESVDFTGTACLQYGGQSSVRCDQGNFSWRDGGAGGNLFCDYSVSPNNSGANIIEGAINEASRGLLYMNGPSAGGRKMTTLSNVRFSGDDLAAIYPYAIEWRTSSSLLVQNCHIGDPYCLRPTRILIDFGNSRFEDLQAAFINTTIDSTEPTARIFDGYVPSEIINCKHTSGPTNSTESIGRAARYLGSLSGIQSLECGGWREIKLTLKDKLKFDAFKHMPVGEGTPIRLLVSYASDARSTTIIWPDNVIWPRGGAPARGAQATIDVFEFWRGGGDIYGKVIGQGYTVRE